MVSSSGFVPKSVFAINFRHIGFSYYVCSHFTNPSLNFAALSPPSFGPFDLKDFPVDSWVPVSGVVPSALLFSLYLLVSLLTCSSLVPRSRLVWRIRLSVVPRSIAGGIFSNFRPGPILAGSSKKAPVDPPRLLWVHSLTCFTFMSLKWSRNPIRPQASSRGSPRNHVFGLLSASNLANSVREAPADCFSNFWVHASLLSLSSTHFSHISHKPRLLFLSFLFFFFHLASIHSVFSSSPNSPLFLLSSLEFWLVGDLSLFLKLVSLVLFL